METQLLWSSAFDGFLKIGFILGLPLTLFGKLTLF